MKKQVNKDVLIECIIAIFAGSVFVIKVFNGSYLDYVSPKFKIILMIAGILLLLIGVSRIPFIWIISYKSNYKKYLLLAIPILMLIIPHDSITASSIKQDDKNSTNNVKTISSDSQKQTKIDDTSSKNESKTSVENTQLDGLDMQAKKITISDDEFYQWICELYDHYDKYDGFEVSIKGMKYLDDSMSEDEFAIVRLAMVCCAADLAPCGPLCQYDGMNELQDDSWYTVSGILGKKTVDGQMEITLCVNNVEEASAPDEPYIYPYK